MKVYIARIYCPYEGATYARGIFLTREEAEKVAPWFTDNADYFSDFRLKRFCVDEVEIGDTEEFVTCFNGEIDYMKYITSEEDQFSGENDKAATKVVLEKLSKGIV